MQMGKPLTNSERGFNDVTIAPKDVSNQKDLNPKEKERLLNKITGYKPNNELFVDGKKHNKMGKDEFLKLLTHQLQNQDPMKPMEQGKMASELAQFSQLEQLSNLNSKFDGLNKNAKTEDKFYGASFLGKEVVTQGRTLDFEGEGTEADILFTLPKPAAKALVRVFDSNNNMVGEVWKENLGRGNQNVAWDGVALDGTPSLAGEYRVNVLAWDETSEPMQVETKVKGMVESVFFENGETVLLVDGKKVFLRDVDSFHNPGKTAGMKLREDAPQISSALAGVEEKVAAKTNPTNLPIAGQDNSKVNLNKTNPVKAYEANNKQVGTGITNVYDVE
ncbi:MAG: flagellar hook capping FlgD N-terminal domain-containing protein [Bacteriovoracaceae bacterium]